MLSVYDLEWLIKERLRQDREFVARQALIRQAMADRPSLRLRLGLFLIRLGMWLRDSTEERDVEVERVTA